jgi:hypothetical protein
VRGGRSFAVFAPQDDTIAFVLVHPAEARRRFREYAEGEITNENLAWGALLIGLEDNPRIDPHQYLNELDALALRRHVELL